MTGAGRRERDAGRAPDGDGSALARAVAGPGGGGSSTSAGTGARAGPFHRLLEGVRRHPLIWLALGAVALRLLLFQGRGDYVAFDEGWYLILSQNLLRGDGYTLSGLQHVTLSPLFPVLAAGASLVVDDPVWAGRLVAAVTSGLLVVPCWYIFRRLAGRRTALWATGLVAVMPSLAPFVAPFWIGWDLWVGAEPVLHLFLFSGLALTLWALDRESAAGRIGGSSLAGVAFGLAYLARPEAVIVAGFVGLGLLGRAAWLRAPRLAASAVVLGLGFGVAAAPYWIYLHDTLGRWTITGRGVAMPTASAGPVQRAADPNAPAGAGGAQEGAGRSGAARIIERMLWDDEQAPYVQHLYGLDASGTRLVSSYWGVPSHDEGTAARPAEDAGAAAEPDADRGGDAEPADPGGAGARTAGDVAGAGEAPAAAEPAAPGDDGGPAVGTPPRPAPDTDAGPVTGLSRYVRAMGIVLPWFAWPLALVGLLAPRWRRAGREALVAGPVLAASVLIGLVVAVDPRTQLFVAPLLAFYTARGARVLGVALDRSGQTAVSRGFVSGLTAAVLVLVLLGVDARRLYMSVTVGSPHHVVGAENRQVGVALRELIPAGAAVMSWHPAIALFADRDWRVLPYEPFDRIVHYAGATDVEYLVLSIFYPAPDIIERAPANYMVLRLAPGAASAETWRIDLAGRSDNYAFGWLRPS